MATPWQAVIRDWTGANVVVPDLYLLDAHAQIRGIQKGLIPPSSTMPTATLTLMSPKALDALALTQPALATQIRADYALLWEQRRVELYFRGMRNPLFTGRLRTPHQDPSSYTWDCVDTLQDLVDGKTEKQEFFTDTSSNIFKACLKDYLLTYGDNFATADLVVTDGTTDHYAQYDQAVGTINPVADPHSRTWTPATGPGGVWPGAAITSLSSRIAYLLVWGGGVTPAPFWVPACLEGDFVLVADSSAQKVGCGLVLGYVYAPGDVADGTRIVAEIQLDVSAGPGGLVSASLNMNLQDVLNNTDPQFPPVNFPALGVIAPDGSYTLHFQMRVYTNVRGFQVLIDGQEIPGASWVIDNAQWGRSVGFYAANYSSAIGGQAFASDLYFYEKNPVIAEGAITPTTAVRDHGPYAETQLLEVAAIMAAQEDFDMRKNPLPGMDSMDYAPTLGRATGIVFQEAHPDTGTPGRILQGYPKNERNQVKLASELRVAGRPSGSSPPVYVVRDLAAMKRYGRVSRPYSQPDIIGYDALRRVGQVQMGMASEPSLGRTVQVDMSGHEGDLRELDTAIFDAPWSGMSMSERQVMGFDLAMGSKLWTLYLDEYPDHLVLADYRGMQSQIDKLAGGGAGYSTPETAPGITQTSSGIRVAQGFTGPASAELGLGPDGNYGVYADGRRVGQVPLYGSASAGRAVSGSSGSVTFPGLYRYIAFGSVVISGGYSGVGPVPTFYLESLQAGVWVQVGEPVGGFTPVNFPTHVIGQAVIAAVPGMGNYSPMRVRWSSGVPWDGTLFLAGMG